MSSSHKDSRMQNELTLAVLLYIKRHLLDKESKFVIGHHFVDNEGKALTPIVSSIPRVAKRCIGGAVIEALVALKINTNASYSSKEYKVVMYHLGDSLGTFESGTAKINAVMRVNNKEGYIALMRLVDKVIEELE